MITQTLLMLTLRADWFQPHKLDVQESAPICLSTCIALITHDVIAAMYEHASSKLFTVIS